MEGRIEKRFGFLLSTYDSKKYNRKLEKKGKGCPAVFSALNHHPLDKFSESFVRSSSLHFVPVLRAENAETIQISGKSRKEISDMKVLIINGSPRAKGNTYIALSEMAKKFAEEGIESEIAPVGNQNIRDRISCRSCLKNGKCYSMIL